MASRQKPAVTNEQLTAFFADYGITPVIGSAGYGANGFDQKLQLNLRNGSGNLGSFLVDISNGDRTQTLDERLPPSIRDKIMYELTKNGTYFSEVVEAYADTRDLCTVHMTRKPHEMERRPTL